MIHTAATDGDYGSSCVLRKFSSVHHAAVYWCTSTGSSADLLLVVQLLQLWDLPQLTASAAPCLKQFPPPYLDQPLPQGTMHTAAALSR